MHGHGIVRPQFLLHLALAAGLLLEALAGVEDQRVEVHAHVAHVQEEAREELVGGHAPGSMCLEAARLDRAEPPAEPPEPLEVEGRLLLEGERLPLERRDLGDVGLEALEAPRAPPAPAEEERHRERDEEAPQALQVVDHLRREHLLVAREPGGGARVEGQLRVREERVGVARQTDLADEALVVGGAREAADGAVREALADDEEHARADGGEGLGWDGGRDAVGVGGELDLADAGLAEGEGLGEGERGEPVAALAHEELGEGGGERGDVEDGVGERVLVHVREGVVGVLDEREVAAGDEAGEAEHVEGEALGAAAGGADVHRAALQRADPVDLAADEEVERLDDERRVELAGLHGREGFGRALRLDDLEHELVLAGAGRELLGERVTEAEGLAAADAERGRPGAQGDGEEHAGEGEAAEGERGRDARVARPAAEASEHGERGDAHERERLMAPAPPSLAVRLVPGNGVPGGLPAVAVRWPSGVTGAGGLWRTGWSMGRGLPRPGLPQAASAIARAQAACHFGARAGASAAGVLGRDAAGAAALALVAGAARGRRLEDLVAVLAAAADAVDARRVVGADGEEALALVALPAPAAGAVAGAEAAGQAEGEGEQGDAHGGMVARAPGDVIVRSGRRAGGGSLGRGGRATLGPTRAPP